MFNILRKKLRPQVEEAVAITLANKVLCRQRELASWLNKIASNLNPRMLNYVMVFAAFAFASYCIYLIIR